MKRTMKRGRRGAAATTLAITGLLWAGAPVIAAEQPAPATAATTQAAATDSAAADSAEAITTAPTADPTAETDDSMLDPAADSSAPANPVRAEAVGDTSEFGATSGEVIIDGDGLGEGEFYYDEPAPEWSARSAGPAYSLYGGAVTNLDVYQVSVISSAGDSQLVPRIVDAANQLNATGLVRLEVNTAAQAYHAPARGEITLRLHDSGAACGAAPWGKWIGCATPALTGRYTGGYVATGGEAWFPTRLFDHSAAIQTSIVMHELMHTLGLGHSGADDQIMSPVGGSALSPQQGDIAGLRYLASNRQTALGDIDVVTSGIGTISLSGWALDQYSGTGWITVDVLVDGAVATRTVATASRPDVASAFGMGDMHGFTATVAASGGTHRVCVRAIRPLGGSNPTVGCRTIAVTGNVAPIGKLENVTATSASTLRVSGWALDPNTTASITVHLYVDGQPVVSKVADGSRPDVNTAYGKGAAHGFTMDATVPVGTHELCLYGIDANGGPNPKLGCTTASANLAPIGKLDTATSPAGGTVTVTGWALDPDTSASIRTHLYIDGTAVQNVTASGNRPDVATAYGKGAAHGYSFTQTGLTAGAHQVCTFAIDPRGGGNPQLGCATVTVKQNSLPIGAVDAASLTGGNLVVTGWALDPDTTASIRVHLYVDGKAVTNTTANGNRPDVATAYGKGAAHGYSATASNIAAGKHEVCIWAIDSAGGPNPKIGCTTVG